MSQFVHNRLFKIWVELYFNALVPKYGYLDPRPLKLKNDTSLLFQKKELLKTLSTSPQSFL